MGKAKNLPDNLWVEHAILKSIPDMLFHLDNHGTFLDYYQDNVEDLLTSPEVFIGKNLKDIFDEKLTSRFLHAIQQTFEKGQYELEYELFIGKLKYYSAKFSRLNENEVISIVRDISQLRENEIKIKYLLDQQTFLADISQLLNRTFHLETALPEVLRLLGRHTGVSRVYIFEDSDDGTFTSNTFEWCHEGIEPQIDKLQHYYYDQAPSWKKMLYTQGRIFSKNIEELPADMVNLLEPQDINSILVYPLYAEEANYGFIGFDECVITKDWPDDETELLRAVSNIISNAFERRQMIRKLEKSIETQQKLFSVISHDLRGPVANFIEVLELLTSGEITDEKLKDRFLEDLKKASWTTYNLLENLLNWSRSQTHTIILEPEYHKIRDLILANREMTIAQANQKRISIRIEADDDLSIYCDKNSVNLVIRNLLTNAVKFTPENGKVSISAKNRGGWVEVEVADNGKGMPEEIVGNLFKSSSFISTYGTNNEKGTGIGLALCKDFVERNGGHIRAESKSGAGSKFIFTLPKSHT